MNLDTAPGLSAEHQEKALNEVVDLLASTKRKGVEQVIEWVRTSRFPYQSGSEHQHSSYRGGLLSHSLNVALSALRLREEKLAKAKTPEARAKLEQELPKSSVILASLLHDAAKEPLYYYDGTRWVKDEEQRKLGHGKRSLEIVEGLGLQLTTAERIAIRWHDYDLGIEEAAWKEWKPQHPRESKTPLLEIVHAADREVRPLEDGAQKQGLLMPLHYLEQPALKDTELRVRRNLETYPREEVHCYLAQDSFVYNSHKESDKGVDTKLPKGTYSVLDTRYPCALRYDGKVFPSAKVLYFYLIHTQRPELQARLLQCRTTKEAEDLCENKNTRDTGWKSRSFDTWVKVHRIKAECCQGYRRKLKATGSSHIVQQSGYPLFFSLDDGAVPGKALGGESWQGVDLTKECFVGCNQLGQVHEKVRSEI